MKTLLLAMAVAFPASPQIEDGEDPCISVRKIDTFLSQMKYAFRNMNCGKDVRCEEDRALTPLLASVQGWAEERARYREECHGKYGKPFRGRNAM
jgi:hypothetical protein